MIKWIRWEIPRKNVTEYIVADMIWPQICGYFVFWLLGIPFGPVEMVVLYIIQDIASYIYKPYSK